MSLFGPSFPALRGGPLLCELPLAAVATAVSTARLFTRHTLSGWGVAPDSRLTQTAETVVSALVAHAVHASGVSTPTVRWVDLCAADVNVITVQLHLSITGLAVQVWDADPALPAAPGEEEAGPLAVLATLGASWSSYQAAVGKVVWCTLPWEPARDTDATIRLPRIAPNTTAPVQVAGPWNVGETAPAADVLRRVIAGLKRLDHEPRLPSPRDATERVPLG